MYFVFAGENYYPEGGLNDLVGTFPTLEAAEHWIREGWSGDVDEAEGYRPHFDWYQIGTIVDGILVEVR